jgi:2-polyprenyl-6-hydroxyphenyl methylase / 3-demethylubiquinone-9 3-methyltransferase
MPMNVDHAELEKFSALASRWWDPTSEFKPLHQINPLRLDWIDGQAALKGKKVVDVGCGGGILAESMARLGAAVKGIDLAEKPQYDVVTCMEMLEHVPDPAATIGACSQLVKPGGWVFFSTINRNPKSFLFAIIGAEYVLRLLPKGTHEYAKFIKPSELADAARDAQLQLHQMVGMSYNPITQVYALTRDTSVNYLMAYRKP